MSSPAACKNVDKLEGLGLVSRVASTGDRRLTLLAATKTGRSLVRRYESTKARRLGPVLEAVGPGDVEQLTRLLERFSTLLFRTEAGSAGYCLRCAAYGDSSCPLFSESCPCTRVDPPRDGPGHGTRQQEEER